MRNISIIILSVLLVTGCESMEDFQINPNKATIGNPALFLTATERYLFEDVLAKDPIYGENSFLAARYWVGSNFHGEPYQYYRWANGSFNKFNYLRNLRELEKWASGNKSYLALAKLFRSLFFYDMTMRFGDIPYSQAIQLTEGLSQPVYDTQKDIFKGILKELEEVNTQLASSDGIIQGDFIYNGDVLKWRKFVNSFKIRVLLALSKKENNSELNIKEKFAQIMQNPEQYPIFKSNSDNAQRIPTQVAPSGYFSNPALVYMGLEQEFANDLKARKDPRLKFYAEITPVAKTQGLTADDFEAYAGLPGGAPNEQNTKKFNNVSIPNSKYSTVVNYEPVLYLGYSELNFLIAEAIHRGWWPQGNASEYYKEGIRASLSYWNIPEEKISDYINQPLVAFDQSSALELILMQKYYANYQNSGWEAYYTIRRTGIPVVDVKGAGMIEHRMSVRWRYPQDEYILNTKNIEAAVARQYPEGDNIYGMMWILQ